MSTTDEPAAPQPGRAQRILEHAEGSISEDDIVAAARERALDTGAGAVTPAVGALLSLLTRLGGGRAVVRLVRLAGRGQWASAPP